MIQVQVIYAAGPDPNQQWFRSISLPDQSTVLDAITGSGIIRDCPILATQYCHELDILSQFGDSSTTKVCQQSDRSNTQLSVGIFGRSVCLEQILKSGDRVEIYRSLLFDPKQARLKRL